MGSSSSRRQGAVLGQPGSGQQVVGQQVMSLPPENPPYPGPPVQHSFMQTEVEISTTFSGVASSVDQVYPTIAQQLGRGWQLLSFYRIPGASSMSGFASVKLPYLALFRDRNPAEAAHLQLQVVKSTVQVQVVFNGLLGPRQLDSDNSAVYSAIQEKASQGARLICMEMTGQGHHQGFRAQFQGKGPIMGVDVFFEAPLAPCPQQFVYEVVSVPIRLRAHFARMEVECDWMGALSAKLNQGWKLVEIFFDNSMMYQRRGLLNIPSLNSLWFFEKPVARLQDPTPVWQGCFGEHFVKLKTKFGGVRTETGWEGYIQAMGARGWELACILETPEARQTGFASAEMKVMLFFQRPILPPLGAPPSYQPGFAPSYAQPPSGVEGSAQGYPPPSQHYSPQWGSQGAEAKDYSGPGYDLPEKQ